MAKKVQLQLAWLVSVRLFVVIAAILLLISMFVVKEAFKDGPGKGGCYKNGPDSVFTENPERQPNSYKCANVDCHNLNNVQCGSRDAIGCCNTTVDGFR